mgnify:FL=1
MSKINTNIEDKLHRKENNQRGFNSFVVLLAVISIIISISSCSISPDSYELESRLDALEAETKLLKECLIDTLELNRKALRLHQW